MKKLDLAPDEKLIHDGPANMQRGMETVGGWLFLTDSRLVFSSHAFNVQRGVTDIPLRSIRSVQPCWTKFLGFLPISPNSLAVHADTAEHRFVVFERSRWMRAMAPVVPASPV